MTNPITKTLQLRIKDKHDAYLSAMAKEINIVWNFINSTSLKAWQDNHHWISAYDLQKLTSGYSSLDEVKIGAASVQQVCKEHETRRKQFKKSKLRFRSSNPKSSKKSLGWIPFKIGGISYKSGQIKFLGKYYNLWDSYNLNNYNLRSGSFSQDSRGRWYINIVVEVIPTKSTGTSLVGVDLGFKSTATCSDGKVLEGRIYRKYEPKLAKAQRANKKKEVKNIHAKIKNTRKDMYHKFTTELVKTNAAIYVGNVSTKAMIKLSAKSTYDAAWYLFKSMLLYKSHWAGIAYEVINEQYTTQTCSSCGVIPLSSPKGRTGLRIRRWKCSDCGAEHDRDINAALNIAALGHGRLVGGIPFL
jgi:IS605 OrfB family transposase